MSWSITIEVADDGTATIVGQSTGDAAPPTGTWWLGGHVYTPGTAGPAVNLSGPGGSVSASLPPPRLPEPESDKPEETTP